MAVKYDGLNIVNLACFELAVRRKQLIAQAHSYSPGAPSYLAVGTSCRQGTGLAGQSSFPRSRRLWQTSCTSRFSKRGGRFGRRSATKAEDAVSRAARTRLGGRKSEDDFRRGLGGEPLTSLPVFQPPQRSQDRDLFPLPQLMREGGGDQERAEWEC